MGELVIKTYTEDFGLKGIIFRTPFIVGEGLRERNLLKEFIERAVLDEELVLFGEGRHIRDFLYVGDLIDAYERALTRSGSLPGLEKYVLGNAPIAVGKLAETVVRKVGAGRVKRLGSMTERIFDQYADFSKANQILGWKPEVGLEDIISRLLIADYSNRSK
jgi:nucleoside-diphosphate-sugar epimerase